MILSLSPCPEVRSKCGAGSYEWKRNEEGRGEKKKTKKKGFPLMQKVTAFLPQPFVSCEKVG